MFHKRCSTDRWRRVTIAIWISEDESRIERDTLICVSSVTHLSIIIDIVITIIIQSKIY